MQRAAVVSPAVVAALAAVGSGLRIEETDVEQTLDVPGDIAAAQVWLRPAPGAHALRLRERREAPP